MKRFKLKDYKDAIEYDGLSSTQRILVYCLYNCCEGDHSLAYKCKNYLCPFKDVNNKRLPKQHNLTEDKEEQLRQQLIINRNKLRQL